LFSGAWLEKRRGGMVLGVMMVIKVEMGAEMMME
jgi:hypothetical protein